MPKPVEAVLTRALAKDPADRFATADEMAIALREAFVESKVRRINAGQRHTIMMSLQNLREEFESDVEENGLQTPPVVVFDNAPQPVERVPRVSRVKSAPQERALALAAQEDRALKVPSTIQPTANHISLPLALGALALIALAAVAVVALVVIMSHELQEDDEYGIPTVIVTIVQPTDNAVTDSEIC